MGMTKSHQQKKPKLIQYRDIRVYVRRSRASSVPRVFVNIINIIKQNGVGGGGGNKKKVVCSRENSCVLQQSSAIPGICADRYSPLFFVGFNCQGRSPVVSFIHFDQFPFLILISPQMRRSS